MRKRAVHAELARDPVGAILVWEDDRDSATSTDIYAAKVDTNGMLPVTPQGFSVE